MKEIEMGMEGGIDLGATICKSEEGMRRCMVRVKKASFLFIFFSSEKAVKKWGRRIQAMEMMVDSVVDAVGSDDRVVKMMVERFKRNSSNGGVLEMERVLKLGRGVYGKVMKKQALRNLIELGSHEYGY